MRITARPRPTSRNPTRTINVITELLRLFGNLLNLLTTFSQLTASSCRVEGSTAADPDVVEEWKWMGTRWPTFFKAR
jgi:hypothetical protein